MAIKVWALCGGTPECVDEQTAPLGELVREQLDNWCEGEPDEPLTVLLVDESGRTCATMVKDDTDGEIAHVMYSDGSAEHWRCHYVLDREGSYVSTQVTPASWDGVEIDLSV